MDDDELAELARNEQARNELARMLIDQAMFNAVAARDRARTTAMLFASVIKSGEPWTDACETALRDALDDRAALFDDLDPMTRLVATLRESVLVANQSADAAAEAVGAMAAKCSALLEQNQSLAGERDRLRAVADAARAYMHSVDSTDPTITRQRRQECMAEIRRTLRALDVSGEATDG